MNNNHLCNDNKNDGGQITYINGLGFVDSNRTRALFSSIRRSSNSVCFFAMLYFLLQKAFILPVTHFVYFLGADIQINYFTGLIISTPFSQSTILFFADFAALLVVTTLCIISYRRKFSFSSILKHPYSGITSIAVPITIAIGLLGVVLGLICAKFFTMFGVVFTTSLSPITSLAPLNFYALMIGLVLAFLQELFFRGIILTSLRRFGDGFSIIATSLIFAIWTGGIAEFILYFFLSLSLCYFAIRSGSIYTAIISRALFKLIMFLFNLCFGTVEPSLALVIVLLCSILISLYAGYSYITFIKTDKAAFCLKPAQDKLCLSAKISIFSSSIMFILFLAFQLIRIVESTQIIG